MGAFWDSWQLWEKMCFVLGVAIVLTIFLGIGKLIHSHWRLRKYSKAAVTQVGEEGAQMQQKRRGRADSSIPFGVRAIESGVEVEGVWISRANSPNNSSPGTPVSRALDQSSQKGKSSIPTIVMPKAAHPYSSQASDTYSRSETSSTVANDDRYGEAEQSSSHNVSPEGSHRRSHQSYKPRHSSQLRFSSGAFQHEIPRPEHQSLRSGNSSSPSRSPSGSSTESNESGNSPHAPHVYQPRRQTSYSNSSLQLTNVRRSEVDLMPLTRHSGVDLDALAWHRRSHAAEMGQLLPPRSRTSSAEWSSCKSASRQSIAEEVEAPVPSTSIRASDSFKTPDRRPSTLQELDAPSFQSFLETDPLHTERYLPPSADAAQTTSRSSAPNPAIPTLIPGSFPLTPNVPQISHGYDNEGHGANHNMQTRQRKNSLFTEAV